MWSAQVVPEPERGGRYQVPPSFIANGLRAEYGRVPEQVLDEGPATTCLPPCPSSHRGPRNRLSQKNEGDRLWASLSWFWSYT